MQYEQMNTASDEEDYFVVEKVSNFEPKKEPICMDSLSIVNMEHVFNQIKAVADHSIKLNCSTHHLEIASSTQIGLMTTLILRCAMCHYRVPVYSHPPDHTRMNINQCAVIGTIITGGGYAQMEQFLTALNLKSPSAAKYEHYHKILIDALIAAAEIEMLAAAEEEKRLAIERGDVLPCGIPHIPVVADGCWMKRSYGTGRLNSPAGIGTIIGYYSKKVLFLGSRNKNCAVCQCAKRKNTPPREHRCFKNWDRYQPASKMESDTILEGFKTSIEKRGLIYSTLIADGDSSTYKKILDCDPYAGMVRVKKIECSNHLLRNFCKKMRDVVKKTPPGRYRKTVEGSIRLLRVGIQSAARFRANENLQESQQIENLRADIINVPSHVFGEHKECQKLGYFCNSPVKEDEENIVPELMRVGVYQRIQEILRPLLTNAESLLRNKNNNLVECFNGVVAKYTGAKRLNFSQSGSYLARCSAAVIQYNTKELLTRVTKVLQKEPSSIAKRLEARKKHMNYVNQIKPHKRHVRKLFCSKNDPDYGPNSLQPDMEQLPSELGIEKINDTSVMIQSDQQRPESEQHQILAERLGDVE
ncbi:uncharacterized protein LOC143360365 [Halictus rubicundus]|uniref:uncharacterized protein LOC143360365 n=1 Tax=Halictus rubicundus TaxID=77578 RepID=UPI0040358339